MRRIRKAERAGKAAAAAVRLTLSMSGLEVVSGSSRSKSGSRNQRNKAIDRT